MKKIRALTPSQVHSIIAGVIGAGAIVSQYAPPVEHALPGVKWIPGVVSAVALLVAMASRGLKTSTSGTGNGLVSTGPDTYAAAANAASPGAGLSAVEQEVVQTALDLYKAQQAASAARTKDLIATAYGLSAATIADGHAAMDAAKNQTVDQAKRGAAPPPAAKTGPAAEPVYPVGEGA